MCVTSSYDMEISHFNLWQFTKENRPQETKGKEFRRQTVRSMKNSRDARTMKNDPDPLLFSSLNS